MFTYCVNSRVFNYIYCERHDTFTNHIKTRSKHDISFKQVDTIQFT